MTREPATVPTSATIAECLDRMGRLGATTLPVVDGVGRFTALAEMPALRRYSRRGVTELPVGQVSATCATARPGDDAIRMLALRLAEGRITTVVVNEEGRPIGLVTSREALGLAKVCLPPWTTVSDVARPRAVRAIGPELTGRAALEILAEHPEEQLVVVDADRVRGVVARADLVGREADPVGELLPSFARTVQMETSILQAIPQLLLVGRGAIPIVDAAGALVTMLTEHDVIRALTRQLIASSTVPPPTRR